MRDVMRFTSHLVVRDRPRHNKPAIQSALGRTALGRALPQE